MNTIDFCQLLDKHKPALVGLLCGITLTGNAAADPNAKAPSIENFIQPNELVLTLSDDWATSDKATQNQLHKPNQAAGKQLLTEPANPAPANIGCGMYENPIPTLDTSLTSRMVGKCNFNYRY